MKKNGFIDGAIIATFAIIISKILGLLYVIPFYSIIGEKGGALYGYAYNIYNIFLIISSAGIPLAISKITSEYETKKEYGKKIEMFNISKKIVSIFSILSFAICFIFSKQIAGVILGDLSGGNTIEDVTFVIRCVSFALLIVPMLSISRGYLQGHKYISQSSFSQVIEQLVRIAVILLGSFFALKILKLPLHIAVGISVFAAAIGAIVAYIYLYFKMKKIDKKAKESISQNERKDIIKKIIYYSIPFIIINISNSIYNTTDMILMIRGLKTLGYSAIDIETISSIFTTWGSKLISIVNSFATGLVISLIPSLVSAYTLKKQDEVNIYFNRSLQVLLFIILPITIFMSIFSNQIWTIFYGVSYYGPIVFRFTILVAFFDSAYIMICSTLQGLYKTKLIYISVLSGLITNLILDLPLMFLFNSLNIYPFYGAIFSTIIGYIVSLGIPIFVLNKKNNISYKETLTSLPRLIVTLFIFIIICLIYKNFINFGISRFGAIIYIGIIGLISFIIYIILNLKIIEKILNIDFKKLFSRIKKKRIE